MSRVPLFTRAPAVSVLRPSSTFGYLPDQTADYAIPQPRYAKHPWNSAIWYRSLSPHVYTYFILHIKVAMNGTRFKKHPGGFTSFEYHCSFVPMLRNFPVKVGNLKLLVGGGLFAVLSAQWGHYDSERAKFPLKSNLQCHYSARISETKVEAFTNAKQSGQ